MKKYIKKQIMSHLIWHKKLKKLISWLRSWMISFALVLQIPRILPKMFYNILFHNDQGFGSVKLPKDSFYNMSLNSIILLPYFINFLTKTFLIHCILDGSVPKFLDPSCKMFLIRIHGNNSKCNNGKSILCNFLYPLF